MILHRAAVLATTVQETCPAWPLAPLTSQPTVNQCSEEINKKYEGKKMSKNTTVNQVTKKHLNNKEVVWDRESNFRK